MKWQLQTDFLRPHCSAVNITATSGLHVQTYLRASPDMPGVQSFALVRLDLRMWWWV